MSIVTPGTSWDDVLPLTNDQRRADWASRYYANGLHHVNGKPRMRIRDDTFARCDPLHGRDFSKRPVAGCPQPEQGDDE